MYLQFRCLILGVLLSICIGCGPGAPTPPPPLTADVADTQRGPQIRRLSARVSGTDVQGVVVMTADGDDIILAAALDNITPGLHSIQIHAGSDCESAGGIMDGGEQSDLMIGDFGTFKATDFRQGKFSVRRAIDLSVGDFSKRAVVVYAGGDAMGNPLAATTRLACGVLTPIVG